MLFRSGKSSSFPEGEEDHRASEAEGSRKYFISGNGKVNNFPEGGGGEGKWQDKKKKADLRVFSKNLEFVRYDDNNILYKYHTSKSPTRLLLFFQYHIIVF